MLKSIKINNRTILVPEGFLLQRTEKGVYRVLFNGGEHYIKGGKRLGGGPRDWYVTGLGDNHIACSGPVDAINLIINA
jgi:hypothetical protein